jgi:Tfp pilus assembly protein PilX
VQSTADYGAYEAPRYFIKQYTIVQGTEGALNLSGYGDNKGSGDVTIFAITARGTGGGQDTAEVILRSFYGRAF